MNKSIGQDISTWSDSWKELTPESEIRMWDFYGLRPWVLKFAPRHGKVIEAGCGLGRYVFYLSSLGLDIEGLDFSEVTLEFLNEWKVKNNFSCKFLYGDVTDLPYQDNSLSGYLSFGVIEHFIEGPHRPLKEAYRVLRPGGIAIISTPSISFNIFINRIKKKIKNIIKKIIHYPIKPEKFFQYWYRPRKLKRFVENSGLKVVRYKGGDLLYAFCERGRFSSNNLKEKFFAYRFSHKFEDTFLSALGAQSITISVKVAENMYCFLCGEKAAKENSLEYYDVPICKKCKNNNLSDFYLRNQKVSYCMPYEINPPLKKETKKTCEFCDKDYITHPLFEDFGFAKKVCGNCLKKHEVNIPISSQYVKPIWRKRK